MKVAIQGIKGSFHHQVAALYFHPTVAVEECATFENLSFLLFKNKVTHAVMAIENSAAGAILPNYALIDKYNLVITGEYYLNVVQHLLALKGETLASVSEIHSHPMALLQCNQFLNKLPEIRLIESVDTALSAKEIGEKKLKNTAAIGSQIAGELYDLEIIQESIQNTKNNMTRFFILESKGKTMDKTKNKASLRFELQDKPGSLATVLNTLVSCDINITKIQSLPIPEQPFQYAFFIDIVFENEKNLEKALVEMTSLTQHCKILGTYKNGKA